MIIIDYLINIPAFFKVLFIFISILSLYRLGLALSLSMIVSALFLTFWTGVGVQGIKFQLLALLKPENYLLLLIITLLLLFSEALSKSNRMQLTVDALKSIFPYPKILLMGLPALVGIIPMPGGALFSAPLIDSIDDKKTLKPCLKLAVNYWFRHIWEYWWPLYPGVILAIQLSGIKVGSYALAMSPFTIIGLLAGYFFILRKIEVNKMKISTTKAKYRDLLPGLIPLLIVIFSSIFGSLIFAKLGINAKIANLYAMLFGLLFAISLIFIKNKDSIKETLKVFKTKKMQNILLVVLGVELFYTALQIPLNAQGLTLVGLMREEFLQASFPIIIIIMLLPFISGLVTGIAFGFVGASFPIIIPLLGDNPSFGLLLSTVVIAFNFGYMGQILSPVHVCLVVTNEYFKTKIYQVYKYIWKPILVFLVWTFLIAGLYYVLFPS
ncbi:MAG: DUF401 family protein [Pseudomonadota bacterium]